MVDSRWLTWLAVAPAGIAQGLPGRPVERAAARVPAEAQPELLRVELGQPRRQPRVLVRIGYGHELPVVPAADGRRRDVLARPGQGVGVAGRFEPEIALPTYLITFQAKLRWWKTQMLP